MASPQAEACAALGGLKLGTVELAGHFHVQSPKVRDTHRDILPRDRQRKVAEGSGRSRRLLLRTAVISRLITYSQITVTTCADMRVAHVSLTRALLSASVAAIRRCRRTHGRGGAEVDAMGR